MATELRFRRGTTAENEAFTGAEGELTYDTDLGLIRTHDGVTPGGRLQDGIIETGGDANNGYWIRADGWAKCWRKATIDLTIGLNNVDFPAGISGRWAHQPYGSFAGGGAGVTGGDTLAAFNSIVLRCNDLVEWDVIVTAPDPSAGTNVTIALTAEGYIA